MYLIEDILNDLGVEYIETGNDFTVSCIYHDEEKPHLNIDKEIGLFHCWSCNAAGTFFRFVKEVSGYDTSETMLYLNGFITRKNLSRLDRYHSFVQLLLRGDTDEANDGDVTNVVLPSNVKIRYNAYLDKRGISQDEILHWDIRICTAFPYQDWILIPINKDGALRTYFLRSPHDSSKIYGYKKILDADGNKKNEGYPRSDILFGMDDCTDYNQPIIVSEGIFDSIFNKRYCKQSVAILGNRILKDQVPFLKKFKEIILLPDNDDNMRGMFMVHSAMELLLDGKRAIYVVQLPDEYKDSGETVGKGDVIGNAINNKINLLKFIISSKYVKFLHWKSTLKTIKKYS